MKLSEKPTKLAFDECINLSSPTGSFSGYRLPPYEKSSIQPNGSATKSEPVKKSGQASKSQPPAGSKTK